MLEEEFKENENEVEEGELLDENQEMNESDKLRQELMKMKELYNSTNYKLA